MDSKCDTNSEILQKLILSTYFLLLQSYSSYSVQFLTPPYLLSPKCYLPFFSSSHFSTPMWQSNPVNSTLKQLSYLTSPLQSYCFYLLLNSDPLSSFLHFFSYMDEYFLYFKGDTHGELSVTSWLYPQEEREVLCFFFPQIFPPRFFKTSRKGPVCSDLGHIPIPQANYCGCGGEIL